MCHRLNVDLTYELVRQKKRKIAPERVTVAKQEAVKLLKIGFADLNRACPTDSFPLPTVNRLIDASSGFRFLSFMDAFSRYNQISMHPNDQEKASFVIEEGIVILSCNLDSKIQDRHIRD